MEKESSNWKDGARPGDGTVWARGRLHLYLSSEMCPRVKEHARAISLWVPDDRPAPPALKGPRPARPAGPPRPPAPGPSSGSASQVLWPFCSGFLRQPVPVLPSSGKQQFIVASWPF